MVVRTPACYEDRNAGYLHHHTPNASWVTGSLAMVRSTADAAYSLRDAVLTHHTSAGKTTEALNDASAYRRVATEVYGLPGLRIEGALAVRTEFATSATGATNRR